MAGREGITNSSRIMLRKPPPISMRTKGSPLSWLAGFSIPDLLQQLLQLLQAQFLIIDELRNQLRRTALKISLYQLLRTLASILCFAHPWRITIVAALHGIFHIPLFH